jgi:glycosyltransferase 2 family protein
MKYAKWLLKLLVTGCLLYWVLRNIDRQSLLNAIHAADKRLLSAAFIPYLVSRVTAASRLTVILNRINLPISHRSGLHLHWVSMFYGIFLPGGLGGDAYKLYQLKQHFPEHRTALLTTALLWDRIIGFAVLLLLAALLFAAGLYIPWGIGVILPAGLVAGFAFLMAARRWLSAILPAMGRLILLSLLTQLAQMLSVCILLLAMGIHGNFEDYMLIFLLSSIAAMFPLSVGGIGIRELVFMQGAVMLGVSEHAAVTVSVLFDIIVTLTAVSGAFLVLGASSSGITARETE